jgi:glucan phosphoethanolaminetransferase (alkaline phosphatase superfamily)
MPSEDPAQRALTASTLALVVAVAAGLLFLPPFLERYLTSVVHLVGNALVLATALLLHWVFLAMAVRRLQRPMAGWVALAVALFPLGGAAALILLTWFSDEAGAAAPYAG